MSDPVAAAIQVEELVADVLRGVTALAGWAVLTEQSEDVAIEDAGAGTINVRTMGISHDTPFASSENEHTQTIEVEVVSGAENYGGIGRNNLNAIAHIAGALCADTTLGGNIFDITPIDTGTPGETGRDIAAASIQFRAVYYTPSDDWFTLSTNQTA